mmetsp:Transcript_22509/g.47643  ORF Transcript_22509/g.47643 Transcript_22509/m.47643 type:complete len:103 (-) Transcript_22509:127-435(-)
MAVENYQIRITVGYVRTVDADVAEPSFFVLSSSTVRHGTSRLQHSRIIIVVISWESIKSHCALSHHMTTASTTTRKNKNKNNPTRRNAVAVRSECDGIDNEY